MQAIQNEDYDTSYQDSSTTELSSFSTSSSFQTSDSETTSLTATSESDSSINNREFLSPREPPTSVISTDIYVSGSNSHEVANRTFSLFERFFRTANRESINHVAKTKQPFLNASVSLTPPTRIISVSRIHRIGEHSDHPMHLDLNEQNREYGALFAQFMRLFRR